MKEMPQKAFHKAQSCVARLTRWNLTRCSLCSSWEYCSISAFLCGQEGRITKVQLVVCLFFTFFFLHFLAVINSLHCTIEAWTNKCNPVMQFLQ